MNADQCPKCKSENVYQDGNLWLCPECGHEWMPTSELQVAETESSADNLVRDANGVELQNGDSVVVIKDLKVKGSSSTVKSGTKVKNIRLSDAGDGHDIACKIDGIGSLNLKSEFVRKVER